MNEEGKFECKKCSFGRASTVVARNNTCDLCKKGLKQPKQGSTECLVCIPGDYVVTLMLQPSDVGGEFEWAPFIRGEQVGDENFEQVEQLFKGNWETKKTRCNAGALAIFNGRRSLHRVRSVYGKKVRIQSVLSYAKTPNEHSTPEKNITLYGKRVEKIYEQRGIVLNRNEKG